MDGWIMNASGEAGTTQKRERKKRKKKKQGNAFLEALRRMLGCHSLFRPMLQHLLPPPPPPESRLAGLVAAQIFAARDVHRTRNTFLLIRRELLIAIVKINLLLPSFVVCQLLYDRKRNMQADYAHLHTSLLPGRRPTRAPAASVRFRTIPLPFPLVDG